MVETEVSDGLARSGPIRMTMLKAIAGAIEDSHQKGDHNNEGGCQQHTYNCSQHNVIHTAILIRTKIVNGDSNHIQRDW